MQLILFGLSVLLAVLLLQQHRRRKRVTRDFQRSERNYRKLGENAIDAIYEHDLQGNLLGMNSTGEGICGLDRNVIIAFANPAAATMTGWTVDELLGANLHNHLHDQQAEDGAASLDRCAIVSSMIDGQKHQTSDDVFWRKDGTSFPVEFISTPICSDRGEILGAVVAFQDISQRRAIERMKNEFVSVVSHGARGPRPRAADSDEPARQCHQIFSAHFDDSGQCRGLPQRGVVRAVQDHGRGIPADKLESIFERFEQVDASDSRKKVGSGLGLAISRSIVKQHGGRIWVESTQGMGSTFYFTLPAAPAPTANPNATDESALHPAIETAPIQ